MKQNYIYIVQSKKTSIPVSDCAFSRQEAREMKHLYESLYKDKYVIKRFEFDKKIR